MTKAERSYPRLPMLDQGPSFYDREPPRNPCAVKCTIVTQAGTVDAVLEDFSHHGCKLRCGNGIIVGTLIELHLPGCEAVKALVKWSIGGSSGCVFRPRLDEDKLRAALESAGSLQACD
jgi:hypothetical protein